MQRRFRHGAVGALALAMAAAAHADDRVKPPPAPHGSIAIRLDDEALDGWGGLPIGAGIWGLSTRS